MRKGEWFFPVRVFAACGLFLVFSAPRAGTAEVVTDSTKAGIEIGLTYHGDRIYFFGSMGGIDADAVVVKLTSPVEKVKLNLKGRVGPFWMNVKQYEVDRVPFMYKIHASESLEKILTPETAEALGIGFDTIRKNLSFHIVKGKEDERDRDALFEGLLRLKKRANLYKIDDASRIEIKKGQVFKHYFTFPSGAKAGEYLVESFLFKDKNLVGRASEVIAVKKVGLEEFVYQAANEHPVWYGICAVLIALCAGLLVGFVFKGGGH